MKWNLLRKRIRDGERFGSEDDTSTVWWMSGPGGVAWWPGRNMEWSSQYGQGGRMTAGRYASGKSIRKPKHAAWGLDHCHIPQPCLNDWVSLPGPQESHTGGLRQGVDSLTALGGSSLKSRCRQGWVLSPPSGGWLGPLGPRCKPRCTLLPLSHGRLLLVSVYADGILPSGCVCLCVSSFYKAINHIEWKGHSTPVERQLTS